MSSQLLRKDLSVESLRKREDNPNSMSSKEFDLLVDNIQRQGFVDPIFVWDNPEEPGVYEIIGGHHRFDAALFLNMEEVPCTIVTDPEFDREEADFQLVRMNMIKGKLDPKRFFDLYQKYANKYGDAVLQDSFGFADDAEWKRLVNSLAKTLPDQLTKDKFKEAAKEVKTIDGLSELLNKMFTMYGDTLPYSYMVVDYGNQKSIWLQASAKTFKNVEAVGHLCIDASITMDDLFSNVFAHLLSEKGGELMAEMVAAAPQTKLPKALSGTTPTKEKIKEIEGSK